MPHALTMRHMVTKCAISYGNGLQMQYVQTPRHIFIQSVML